MLRIKVDQRRCIGNGVCAEIAPEVFFLGDDDVAYLHEDGRVLAGDATVIVPQRFEDAVLEAVDQCPAGCIDVEVCVSS
jgi:ferredoxin